MDKHTGLDIAVTARAGPASEQEVNLATLVKRLHEKATTIRHSLAEIPPVNPLDSSQPRKKAWFTRSRTGCLACRSRHVKCDETQPCCKRCTLASRQCVYRLARGSVSPVGGLPSPDWHVKEALEYYAHIMAPMHEYHGDGDSAFEFSHKNSIDWVVADEDFDGDRFAMHILTHRLQCLFSTRRTAPRYGAITEFKPLWARLFNQVSIVIQKLNLCIATSGRPLQTFRHIRALLYVELSFAVPAWRAHAEGFGALIKSYSCGLSELFSAGLGIVQYALLVASMCNTTSPPKDQIEHMSNWSDEDIFIAYSNSGCHAFPCPTAAFQAMIRITHLRTLVAANKGAPEWEGLAREAYAKIQSVEPHRWGEPYLTDDKIYILAARVYQASVALYAILTLPSRLAAVFTFPLGDEEHMATTANTSIAKLSTNTSGGYDQPAINDGVEADGLQHKQRDKLDLVHAALEEDNGQTARVRYRSRLFRLFRQATLELPESGGLMWPSAVLGVALQDHKEEQAILLDHIGYLRGWPESENGATCLYDKLVMFWGSGKKHWDQCFYEPTSVMT